MWEELTEEERKEFKKQSDTLWNKTFIELDEELIDLNKNLIDNMKNIIKIRINKEPYKDTDQRIVELALRIIGNSEKQIKDAEKDIYMLVKYPVGSNKRPMFVLKGGKDGQDRQGQAG